MGDSQGEQYLLNHPVEPLPHPVNHPVPLIDPTNTTYYITWFAIRPLDICTSEIGVGFLLTGRRTSQTHPLGSRRIAGGQSMSTIGTCNMPRGNVAGALYYNSAVRCFCWPVSPAQPASAVCVVMPSYHEWKTRFP